MRKKNLLSALIVTALSLVWGTQSFAQFGIGADVVSRYVWRGTDYGNQLSVQPYISYGIGNVEVGAWGSWGATDGSANENDLYVSYSQGPISVTLTDYAFPAFSGDDNFFKFGNDHDVHFFEASAAFTQDAYSLMAGYFFSGETLKKSLYVEGSYVLPFTTDGVSASLVVGAGNEAYTTDDDFTVVVMGLTVSKESWSASYIVNPDQETAFLVIGKSF